jgi:mono/diheme cytochrome c family protein
MKDIFAPRLNRRLARLSGFSGAARECELSQSQASRIHRFFAPSASYVAKSDYDAVWNRGAYLVQGPGHCGACHTPRGIGMQEKADRPRYLVDEGHRRVSRAWP